MELERAVVGQRFRLLTEIAGEAAKEVGEPLSYWYLGGGRFEVILDRGNEHGLVPVGMVGSSVTDEGGHDRAEQRNLKMARFWAAFSPVAMANLLSYMRDYARRLERKFAAEWHQTCKLEDVLRDILSRPEVLDALRGEPVLERATSLLRAGTQKIDSLPTFDDDIYRSEPRHSTDPRASGPFADAERTTVIEGAPVVLMPGVEIPVKHNGVVTRFVVDEVRRNPDGDVVFGVTEAEDLFSVSRKWIRLDEVQAEWPTEDERRSTKRKTG